MTLHDLARQLGIRMGPSWIIVLLQVHAVIGRAFQAPSDIAADPFRRLRWLVNTSIHLAEAIRQWFFFGFTQARSLGPDARSCALKIELPTQSLFIAVLEV